MKIPKGVDLQIKTENEVVEIHITAALTNKAQARELIDTIRKASTMLEGERRIRKPKVVAAA
jgi:hypothetical protein